MKSGYTCEEIKNLLPMYVCNETSEEENEIIRAHIKDCPLCKEEYEMLLDMERAFDEADYEAPEKLHENIMKAVHKSAEKSKKHRKYIGAAVSFAAVVAAVLLLFVSLPSIFIKNNEQQIEISGNTIMFEGNISESGGNNDYIALSDESFGSFKGSWTYVMENGNKAVMTINDDKSVEMCIEDENGVKQYYDGMLEINGKIANITQSDGERYFSAQIEMFIKEGRMCINVLSGSMPISQKAV